MSQDCCALGVNVMKGDTFKFLNQNYRSGFEY